MCVCVCGLIEKKYSYYKFFGIFFLLTETLCHVIDLGRQSNRCDGQQPPQRGNRIQCG